MTQENQGSYTKFMFNSINEVLPGIAENVEKIVDLPILTGTKILSIIISYACQAQNTAIISIAREEFKKIPSTWVNDHIEEAIETGIDLEDDWDYRRFLELLFESVSELKIQLVKFINIGMTSSNPDIKEAAEDFYEKLE